MNTHTRIGVLRGGPSSEHEVSLKTGRCVLNNLPKPYELVDIFIDKEGTWHKSGRPIALGDIAKHADIIFNALHGEYGEDGTAARELEQLNIPFTGSRALGSALAMHKIRAKETLRESGILVPRHRAIVPHESEDTAARSIFESFLFPLIVKPVSGGSSLFVSKVAQFSELVEAIERAREEGDVMVEEYVHGKEATVGIIEGFRGKKLYTLPPVEIRPAQESPFFDFEAKYSGGSEEICPGNFTSAEKRALEAAATLVHETLGLSHYSRSDFIVSPRGIYFLEVNTLPGLTGESLFPKALNAVGSSLPEFLAHIVALASSQQR